MAEIQINNSRNPKHRAKRPAPHIDMTPMVDLAFLLLTFFVLTATFGEKKCMELTFFPPALDPSPVNKGITFLLAKNDRIFYYEGELKLTDSEHDSRTNLTELNFSSAGEHSLHNFLLEKNKALHNQIRSLITKKNSGQLDEKTFKQLVREKKAANGAYTYLVKADDQATYKNVIDVVDELNINVVGKYNVVDPIEQELTLLKEALK